MTGAVECRYHGRDFTTAEMALLRELIAGPPVLNRNTLSKEFCRRIGWYKADGGLKDMMARVVMLAMHRDGRIELPPPKWPRPPRRPATFGPDTVAPLLPPPADLELEAQGNNLKQEEILVDLPFNRVVVRGGDILTRTDGDHVGTPNLFFDPERWSQAYEHQKQCGFVFTPRNRVKLVALASRIVFFERFGLVMDEQAHRAAKVTDVVCTEWVKEACSQGLCSPECAEVLQGERPQLALFHEDDFALPENWLSEDPGARSRIADDLNANLPAGLPAAFHKAAADAVRDLASFIDMVERTGSWTTCQDLSESQLQTKLREHLLSREVAVTEGSELSGGETDLVLYDRVVVENKVHKVRTRDPFEVGPHHAWQTRRYSIALCSRVGFTVVGYRPSDESVLLPLPSRIRVLSMPEAPEKRCEVRVVVPFGAGVPSSAKRP